MTKFGHNSKINFLGEELYVEFSERRFLKSRVLRRGKKIVVFKGEDLKSYRIILNNWLIEEARAYIGKRIKYYAKKYGFEFNRVAIKDTKTRWGSCSSQKNLNFNWRLSLGPLKILDYVVVHELCHTRQMNHSSKFWDEVEEIMPSYKVSEMWLKANERHLLLA